MKIFFLSFLMSFLSFFGWSQEHKSGNDLDTKSQIPKIFEIAQNKVSHTMTVYTYHLNNGLTKTTQVDDSGLAIRVSEEVESIILSFLDVDGISECTFDSATQTFTILSLNDTDLSPTIEKINNIK